MKNQGMNKYRKPNAFLYFLFRLVSKIISIFFFNLKIERNELKKVKGPYVIIANHESIIDFICLANVNKNRHHFVLSNSFYNSINIKFIFDGIRAIPKQQFQTTPTDLKLMKRDAISLTMSDVSFYTKLKNTFLKKTNKLTVG